MKEKKEYQIRIPGRLVPVSKEVYLAYYRWPDGSSLFLRKTAGPV